MGDPVYKKFTITSATSDCLPPPPTDPAKDKCTIEVEEVDQGLTFTLERKSSAYQVASGDASKVTKAYPSYNAPAKELADFLLVRSDMYKVFGDKKSPTEIMNKVSITFDGADKLDAIFNWLNIMANFVSHGQLDPKTTKMKELQTTTIGIAIYTFADPVLGVSVEKLLKGLKDNSSLNQGSRKRAEWLLGILSAREKFWAAMKPAMDRSQKLSDTLKVRSVSVLSFLFANHILAEKGYNEFLFSAEMKDAAKTFHDVLSKVDTSYDASKNFYAFIRDTMVELKKANIPSDFQKDFLTRVSFIETEFDKAARQEMLDILAAQPAEDSFKEYLKIKYGDTPIRAAAVEILAKNITVKKTSTASSPSFNVPMEKISSEWRAWVELQPTGKRDDALQAVNHLLKTLFEKDGKMEIFWDKKVQTVDNFYNTGNFSILSTNKKALEDLIVWSVATAKSEKAILPGDTPHVALRKWTLGTELGIGVVGLGVGTGLAFSNIKDPNAKWYGAGSAVILGSSALGAAGGNYLSYKLNVTKNQWLFDAGGAVLGGLIGGLIYGFTTTPPWKGDHGNPTRYPVDEYGP